MSIRIIAGLRAWHEVSDGQKGLRVSSPAVKRIVRTLTIRRGIRPSHVPRFDG